MDAENTPPVVVPSDITLCENLYSTGTRKLTFMENLGLFLTPNPIRFRYTKNGRDELRAILSKSYGEHDDTVTEILKSRQESVSKMVKAKTFNLFGGAGLGLLTLYSLRFSNIKTKVIVLPFATYAGCLLGRIYGNGYYGRWSEYSRDRALGQAPASRYLTRQEIKVYT
ncbi:hypothetical protein BdWA1_003094 [Babesia duncani]|uniref:Uncharacterized protein n=1 Tax=Babesia duncani TaxID=323732 RepID=A0AAD9PJA3_9APIC|nr:hypothetical protein BdWA1_003094 [Babesia duncani]